MCMNKKKKKNKRHFFLLTSKWGIMLLWFYANEMKSPFHLRILFSSIIHYRAYNVFYLLPFIFFYFISPVYHHPSFVIFFFFFSIMYAGDISFDDFTKMMYYIHSSRFYPRASYCVKAPYSEKKSIKRSSPSRWSLLSFFFFYRIDFSRIDKLRMIDQFVWGLYKDTQEIK